MRDRLLAAYDEVYERLTGTLSSLSAGQDGLRVPATPDWTVRELLAHVVAGPTDLTGAGFPEAEDVDARDHWRDPRVRAVVDAVTARQVRERAGHDVPALLREWSATMPAWREVLRGTRAPAPTSTPFIDVITTSDAIVHDDDLHQALGRPLPDASPALSFGVTVYAMALDTRLRALRLPGVRLVSDAAQRQAGEGVVATLNADERTLLRALTSRLPDDQVRGLSWDGDPSAVLPVLGAYRQPVAVPAQPQRDAAADAEPSSTG